jgi:hypothetical protein
VVVPVAVLVTVRLALEIGPQVVQGIGATLVTGSEESGGKVIASEAGTDAGKFQYNFTLRCAAS